MGRIRILQLIEGAREARGVTVVIDVLRAFSLECYLTDRGAGLIRPVETVEEAFAMRERFPGCLLIGERGGRKCEGFDFGNTPGGISREQVEGKLIFHTTSAGTQGIANARQASEILTGSLVNARATAEYIRRENPEEVSLVCMGNGGVRFAAEDQLCAEYIRSLVEGHPLTDLEERIRELPTHGAEHFFNPATQDIFPEPDFWLCMKTDIFPFVLRVTRDETGWRSDRVDMPFGKEATE